MITQFESGLTDEQYAAFQTQQEAHAFQVVAHRVNLKFDLLPTNTLASYNTADFLLYQDADGLFRLLLRILQPLERFNPTTNTWTRLSGFKLPVDLPTSFSAAMTRTPDGELRIYCCAEVDVKVNTSLDNGHSWSGWSDTGWGGQQITYSFTDDLTVPVTYGSTSAPYAQASSQLQDVAYYHYDKAFDNNFSDTGGIWAANGVTGWLRYVFQTPVQISRYTLVARTHTSFLSQSPRTWTLRSSVDGINWTSIHTVSSATGWKGEQRVYTIVPLSAGLPTTSPARYLELNITANNGDASTVTVSELELMGTVATTSADIIFVSIPVWNRVHYVYRDAARELYNLRVREWDGEQWDEIQSDIWLTCRPGSLSVVNLDGVDVILMDTEVPGTQTVANEDNSPVKYVLVSGGVIGFTYQYATWSNHFEIDVVDEVTAWRRRDHSKVSVINGVIHLVTSARDGTKQNPIVSYRHYTSADGRSWSAPRVLPVPVFTQSGSLSDSGYGLQLALVGDSVYGFECMKVFISPATLVVGHSPASMQIDLTDRIDEYSLSSDGALQASLLLSNDDGWLDNHAVLNMANTVWLIHRAGYWLPSAANPSVYERVLVQIGQTCLDSIEIDEQLPEKSVRITARDHLAYMTDLVASEQAHYWKSQLVGADNYADVIGGNYGGLSHTATQTGAFKTRSRYLEVDADNEESVAFSTFSSDLWNGTIQVGFLLTSSGSNQYAGVVFRAYDSSNMWYAVYEQASDKIHLYLRRSAISLGIAQSPMVLGWSGNPAITRYVRADFHYGQIRIYSSSDSSPTAGDGGCLWTLACEHMMDCSWRPASGASRLRMDSIPLERGSVGVIGKGKL